jgi:uncharacterized membrane protein
MDMQFFQHLLLKKLSFLYCIVGTFVKKSIDQRSMHLFLDFLVCVIIGEYMFIYQYYTILIIVTF